MTAKSEINQAQDDKRTGLEQDLRQLYVEHIAATRQRLGILNASIETLTTQLEAAKQQQQRALASQDWRKKKRFDAEISTLQAELDTAKTKLTETFQADLAVVKSEMRELAEQTGLAW